MSDAVAEVEADADGDACMDDADRRTGEGFGKAVASANADRGGHYRNHHHHHEQPTVQSRPTS